MSSSRQKKLLGVLVLLGSFATTGSAFAHAHLKSETPAANSTVSAPHELRLVFSEGIEAALTKVELSQGGTQVELGRVATDPVDQKILVVTPAAVLKAGDYQVHWRAVSVDTHRSEGTYGFKVGN